MKKLIFIIILLTSTICSAQTQVFCNTGCYSLPSPPNESACGMDAGKYPFKVDTAVVLWTDCDANNFCSWKWTNPAYPTGYAIEILQDGKPYLTEKNWQVHGLAADNIKYADTDNLSKGQFHYYFPVAASHIYDVLVGKECKSGGIAWSKIKTFDTYPTQTAAPATIIQKSNNKTRR